MTSPSVHRLQIASPCQKKPQLNCVFPLTDQTCLQCEVVCLLGGPSGLLVLRYFRSVHFSSELWPRAVLLSCPCKCFVWLPGLYMRKCIVSTSISILYNVKHKMLSSCSGGLYKVNKLTVMGKHLSFRLFSWLHCWHQQRDFISTTDWCRCFSPLLVCPIHLGNHL